MEKKNKIREFLPLIALGVMVAVIVLVLVLRPSEDKGGSQSKILSGMVKDGNFIPYFNTTCIVYDYSGMSESEFSSICLGIESRLESYHKLFDIYNEYEGVTNIATINSAAGRGPISVSEELFDFLEYCVEIHELTGGEVNIAMGSVLSVWHGYREMADNDPDGATAPTEAELAEAAKHTSISSLALSREGLTVELTDPAASLDVGALGKGYAAEMIAEWLKSEGVSGFLLDLGGNIRAVGQKPSGDGWVVGIKNPRGSGNIKRLNVKNTSVVTSGDYERKYFVDGKRYHHIIDPDTNMPAEHFASVSIITESSALADGLSTALFCMTYDEGAALVRSLADRGISVRVVWVGLDGAVTEV